MNLNDFNTMKDHRTILLSEKLTYKINICFRLFFFIYIRVLLYYLATLKKISSGTTVFNCFFFFHKLWEVVKYDVMSTLQFFSEDGTFE